MGFDRFLDAVAKQVEKRPKVIILVVILMTIASGYFLKDLEYETDMAAFFPENEVVAAKDRVDEHFGPDEYSHLVAVSGVRGQNALSVKALREEYDITQAAEDVDGVVGTQSVASYVNMFCNYVFNPRNFTYSVNESKTIMNTNDEEVQGRIEMIKGVLNGTIDASDFSGSDVSLDPEAIRFMFGLLVSNDFDEENFSSSKTLIIVEMDGNYSRSDLRTVVGEVKESISSLDLRYVEEKETSEYYIAYEMESTIQPTMVVLGIGIVTIITVILVGSFRHLSYVWAPMLTLVVAIALTFATMVAMGYVLSILSVAVIPLLVGLGVDYTVHISRRYQEGLFDGNTITDSISTSIKKVGAALFLAFATTVVAFLSNLVSDVPPIREFGIMCALGITYAYLLAITFYPAIRMVLDRKRGGEAAAPKPTPTIDGIMRKAANIVEERPAPIMVLTLVMVVGSLYAATLVPVEFNVEAFLPSDWESIETNEELRDNFKIGAYSTVFVLMEDDDLANPVFLDSVFNVTDSMQDDTSVVSITDSLTNEESYFIDSIAQMTEEAVKDNASVAVAYNLDNVTGRPLDNCTNADIGRMYQHLATDDTLYDGIQKLSYAEALPKLIHRVDNSSPYTAGVIRQRVVSVSDSDTSIITEEAMENIEGFKGAEASVTGSMILTQVVIDSLSESQIESTIISVIFAILVLTIIYRSITLGLVSITPVIVAMSLSLGTMWLLGISLNALTIMITALTIGLGVDYAIHVVERFREEESDHKISTALHRTMENTGAALLISALTTIFGFGVLVIAGIPIFTDFGLVTAVMIAYSLLAAAIVTPVILVWMARQKLKKGKTPVENNVDEIGKKEEYSPELFEELGPDELE